MTSTVVVLARPKAGKEEGTKTYAAGVQPRLAAAGITPKFREPVIKTIAGSLAPATVMILE